MSWRATPMSLCWSNDLQFEIQKRCCYLKNIPLDFVFLFLKLGPTQVVISVPLWVKLTIAQLLLFFLCNFSSFFSYVGGIPVTNHFSLLLIDRYILAILQIIAHKEHLRYSFWSVAIFWISSEVLARWSQQQKLAKTASKSLLLSSS